jgi:hypothetical protein
MNRPACDPVIAKSVIVTDRLAAFVIAPAVYEALTVTDWFAVTAVVVSVPAAIVAYAELSLHAAVDVTLVVEPSLKVAVATYNALALSETVAGPVTAIDVSVTWEALQFDGACCTRAAIETPLLVARTRHGEAASVFRSLQRPSRETVTDPIDAVVSALLTATDAPARPVPSTRSSLCPESHEARDRVNDAASNQRAPAIASAADMASVVQILAGRMLLSFLITTSR